MKLIMMVHIFLILTKRRVHSICTLTVGSGMCPGLRAKFCGANTGGGGLAFAAALVGGGGARFRFAIPLVTAAWVCVGVYFLSNATCIVSSIV